MLTVKGKTWDLAQRTHIMGILNVTPDSFSDGGMHNTLESAVVHAKQMALEGADIIDVGGESTRPGSAEVGEAEEIDRVLPVVKALAERIELPISVDTYKANVAKCCLEAGAAMINDVWGFQRDTEIANVVAHYGCPAVLMHNQVGTDYSEDIILSMKRFFEKSIHIARSAGIEDANIVLDPGIGFGKTPEQNIVVMGRLSELKEVGFPILLGTSRKSMIGKILDLPAHERLEGTIATNVLGIQQGVSIVRVHDVKENRRAALVADAIVRGYQPWITSV